MAFATVPGYLDTLGWTYYKLGQYESAISVLGKAVELDNVVAEHQYHLGMAYHRVGDVERWRIHIEKSLESEAVFVGSEEAVELVGEF
ncbi:MAG: tetratricopeptide repeat protein [Magnetococcales bacterium]|nr:tetratricopeptide repeat protein [Magnetococcales bacterium]